MNNTLLSKLRQQELILLEAEKSLKAAIAKLESAGLTDGKPTWNSGKYLYMYHPKPGGRDRRYIGSNPEKVQAALDAVGRTALHQALTQQCDAADALRGRIGDTLSELHNDLAIGIEQHSLDIDNDD